MLTLTVPPYASASRASSNYADSWGPIFDQFATTAESVDEALGETISQVLIGALTDALSSRKIDLTFEGDDADAVRGMPIESWETVKEMFDKSSGTGPITATLGSDVVERIDSFDDTLIDGLQLVGVSEVNVHAPTTTSEVRLNTVCAPNSGEKPWRPKVTVIRTEAGSSLKHIYVNKDTSVEGRGFSGLGVTVHHMDEQGHEVCSGPLEQARVEPAWKQDIFLALSASLRGLVLDLSSWTDDRALQSLKLQPCDWAQWQGIAGVELNLVLVSPELQSSIPLIEGVDQVCTTDVEQDYDPSSFEPPPLLSLEEYEFAAQESLRHFLKAMESGGASAQARQFNVELFESMIGRIDPVDSFIGDSSNPNAPTVLDLETDVCEEVAAVIRTIRRDAWKALLEHPEAACLQSVRMSEALAQGGPLPIALAQVRA